jgi:peptide-methionine (S)-S-oxide reductase
MRKTNWFIAGLVGLGIAAAVLRHGAQADGAIGNPACGKSPGHVGAGTPLTPQGQDQLAVFSQGCFWGVEERFRKVPGVVATAVVYTGGHVDNPSYEDVSGHGTGHAESVLIEFDPAKVTYAQLLDFFWKTHDPTSGDAQGPDRGSQYRSAIFTFGAEQQKQALASRDRVQAGLSDPITTQITPVGKVWKAEEYHQQWDEKHGALSCPIPHQPRFKR